MHVGARVGMDAHTNATSRINHRGIMRMTSAGYTRNAVRARVRRVALRFYLQVR